MIAARLSLPWRGWPVVLLCAVYLLAGSLDHAPWKTWDAVHLGVAWEFASHGHWLTPRIANDPWLGAPPLYHWVAALLGNAFSFALPFHNAARLATLFFGILLLTTLTAAARQLRGNEQDHASVPLLAIGTLGLLVPIHEAEPAIALIAAQAILLLGLFITRGQPIRGGLLAGLGLGLGGWVAGSLGLLFLAPLVPIPLAHANWRNRRTLLGLLLALACGSLIAALWPLLLCLYAPNSLMPMLTAELQRIKPHPFSLDSLRNHLELLGWSSWPIFPLALWTLWGLQRTLGSAQVLLPLLASLLSLLLLFVFGEPQPLQHLLLLPPLTLLAASGVARLRRGAANAFDWFGMMTATLLAALVWLGGIAMNSGQPERLAHNLLKATPDFVATLTPAALLFALACSLFWCWLIFRLPRSPWRGITHWSAGVTLCWVLLATLWFPLIDHMRSYRPVAAALEQTLGNPEGCIAQRGVGDAQKASLRYFNGIATVSANGRGRQSCPWLLVQADVRSDVRLPGWRKVWEGGRPGDKSERLRLYRRALDSDSR